MTAATSDTAKAIKMEICRSCPYSRQNKELGISFLTCGKFMTGEMVTHNGKPIKLCGCVMAVKTGLVDFVSSITDHEFESLKCPAERW